MTIDAHQHFWTLGRNDCAWPTPSEAAIHRDFGPPDLEPLAEALGISGTVLVQSQPSDRDTDFLLRLADETQLVKAVVGWADLAAPYAPDRIARLAAHPKLRGLRPMLQSLEPDDWILDPRLEPAIAAMIEHDLRFDALVRPQHLPHLQKFAERHPALSIVIDHGAKPDIARGMRDPWRAQIAALAALPRVFCKLSGLATEAAPNWKPQDLKPYVNHLLAVFGPDRLMWGSDWPVINLAGDYADWLWLAEKLTPPENHPALFVETARRFYRF